MSNDRRLLILRADASRRTGFGHLVRTCALAGYMRDDFDCRIYSYDSTGAPLSDWSRQQARDAGAEILPLEGTGLDDAGRAFLTVLEQCGEKPITVLDNYYYEAGYQTAVRERSRALVCLDDMHRRHFTSDVLISFVPLDRTLFSMEPYTRFLGGFEWSFLRAPFLRPLPRAGRERRSVVVAMGGADPLGLTNRIVPEIRRALPDAVIEVVAGSTVRLDGSIDMMPRTVVHRNLDAEEMADVMDRSRLGIFPASTICVEAFARHIPVAAGYFTDNQVDFYHEGVRRGLFMPLGDLREFDAARLAESTPRAAEMDFVAARDRIIKVFKEL